MKEKLVVLSGAGVSAESGISTFRDPDGVWKKYDIKEVASIGGWIQDPEKVLDFYNARRKQLREVQPNPAHYALADLEKHLPVSVITQNVDDLHERAGSSRVIHLHGELLKVRSTLNPDLVYEWTEDLNLGDTCALGSQLRPHIVWFGEEVPLMEYAAKEVSKATLVLIVGTSLQVYPAAGLIAFAPENAPIYYIDPNPALSLEFLQFPQLRIIAENAGTGVPKAIREILDSRNT